MLKNEPERERYGLAGRLRSYWLSTVPDTDYGSLEENLSVDVVVVGAGIVGISSALLLKEAGLDVALIDANRIAKGVSGHTAGKITSLHQVIYHYLISKFGFEKARMYADANQAAIEKIANWVEEINIPCDFVRKPAYTYARLKSAREIVEKEVRAAQSLNLPASFEENISLPFATYGAVCLKNQAQFHPRKYLLALAKSFLEKQGRIFEKTRALDIEENESRVVLTDKGPVKAKNIIISSHFPFFDKEGFFAARLFPWVTYMEAMRIKELFPRAMFIGSDDYGHSFRTQPNEGGELVLVGGEDHPAGQSPASVHYESLAEFSRSIYDSPSIEYRWAGQYQNTVDRVPYIGRLPPAHKHIFLATGFGGWGMTTGTAAGIILKDLILGNPNPWAEVYDPSRLEKEN